MHLIIDYTAILGNVQFEDVVMNETEGHLPSNLSSKQGQLNHFPTGGEIQLSFIILVGSKILVVSIGLVKDNLIKRVCKHLDDYLYMTFTNRASFRAISL